MTIVADVMPHVVAHGPQDAVVSRVLADVDAVQVIPGSPAPVSVLVVERQPDLCATASQQPQSIVVERQQLRTVMAMGLQGPPGVAGSSEEDMPYAKRVDFITDSLLYRGEAAPGSATSDPVWRIRRITIGGDGDVTEEWAGGTAGFSHAWDDRASLSYV